jgi:hypothetical protein
MIRDVDLILVMDHGSDYRARHLRRTARAWRFLRRPPITTSSPPLSSWPRNPIETVRPERAVAKRAPALSAYTQHRHRT